MEPKYFPYHIFRLKYRLYTVSGYNRKHRYADYGHWTYAHRVKDSK